MRSAARVPTQYEPTNGRYYGEEAYGKLAIRHVSLRSTFDLGGIAACHPTLACWFRWTKTAHPRFSRAANPLAFMARTPLYVNSHPRVDAAALEGLGDDSLTPRRFRQHPRPLRSQFGEQCEMYYCQSDTNDGSSSPE